ncbi:cell surface protein SprA, partial [Bacteroidota bacterium]
PQRSSGRSSARPAQSQEDTTEVKTRDYKAVKGFLRFLMMVRSVNMTYNNRAGTVMPGFLPVPFLFGMDSSFSGPGLDFILGSQSTAVKHRAADNGWLATSEFLTFPFTQNNGVDLKLTANVEPFKDWRIQIAASKTKTENYQEIFRYGVVDTLSDGSFLREPVSLSPTRTGSYNITLITIGTSFIKDDDNNNSPTFHDFETNRHIIRDRLNEINPHGEYNLNSQDVLIPAFLAAYSGTDINAINLSPFPRIPLPNWRFDYAGLGKIEALKEIFSSVNLTHSYSSTYSARNYTNSLFYEEDIELNNDIEEYPLASKVNENGELIPAYVITQVIIAERFAPLIGLNVRTKSRLTARIEYKTERNLALNMSNAQVTELNNKDMTFDIGYTKSKFKLPFKIQQRVITLDNDLQFRLNFTIRDTKTVQRKIEENSTITAGNINFQLRPSIQYTLNDRLNITFYFERNINEPRISSSFKRATTAFGTQVRFSLAQ